MFEIRKALLSDLQDIFKIHLKYVKSALGLEQTFIEERSIKDIERIVKEELSYVITVQGKVEGYSLFQKYESGVIGRGIILQKKIQGLGLQRIIYSFVNSKSNLYIICSRYNKKSTKNIISLGMLPLEFLNEMDVLYEKKQTHR